MPLSEPPPSPPPAPRNSWLPLVLVLGLLTFVLAMSFMLAGGVLTLAIAGVAVALGGAAAFHYVVWGRWLSRYIRDDVEAKEREIKTTNQENDE